MYGSLIPIAQRFCRRKGGLAVLALLLFLVGMACAFGDTNTYGPWHGLPDPFASGYTKRMIDLAIAPDGTVYVGAFPGGVAKSTDGGQTWTLINTGLPDLHVTTLSINKVGDPIAAVGSGPSLGAFRYTGGRWFAARGISATLRITAFTLDQTGDLYAVTAWAGDVYRSTDDGNSFSKVANSIGQGTGALWTVACGPDGSLYAGGEIPTGLYISHDNGMNWQQFGLSSDQGYKGNLFSIFFNKQGDLLAGRIRATSGTSIQRYTGGRWVESAQGIPGWRNVLSTAIDAHGNLYATASEHSGAGIYRSTDDGQTWQDLSFGINSTVYRRVAVYHDTIYLLAQHEVYKASLPVAGH